MQVFVSQTKAMRDMLEVMLHLAKEPSPTAALTPLALEGWLSGLVVDSQRYSVCGLGCLF
ncbi:MAG: hypothetical protein AB7E55_24560 [Pigmentiphaga sp.]